MKHSVTRFRRSSNKMAITPLSWLNTIAMREFCWLRLWRKTKQKNIVPRQLGCSYFFLVIWKGREMSRSYRYMKWQACNMVSTKRDDSKEVDYSRGLAGRQQESPGWGNWKFSDFHFWEKITAMLEIWSVLVLQRSNEESEEKCNAILSTDNVWFLQQ